MEAIRAILLNDWNPINVDIIGQPDEYDSYIGGIYRLLTTHPPIDVIIEFLYHIETVQMGTGLKQKDDLRPIAQKLMALKVSMGNK